MKKNKLKNIKIGYGYNEEYIVEIDNYTIYLYIHDDFKDLELIHSFSNIEEAIDFLPEIVDMTFLETGTKEENTIDFESKVGLGMIQLKPEILIDQYGEIVEEQNIQLEDIEAVWVSYVPYNESPHFWDLFVRLKNGEDLWWGDALGNNLVEDYLLDYIALEDFNIISSYTNEELKKLYDTEIKHRYAEEIKQ